MEWRARKTVYSGAKMTQITIETQFLGESLRARAEELLPSASKHLLSLRDKSCVGSEWTGWWDYPAINGFRLQNEIQAFKDQLEVPYDAVLVIGIGGSYLGTRAVYEALSHSHKGLVNDKRPILIFAGHHVSEAALIETLDLLDQRLPLVNVISKSGTTTEPSVAFRVIRNYMNERFGEKQAAERIIVTTDKEKGALRQLANDSGYKSFEVPNDIGGRFSVLSAVGLVPLALAGFDTKALMEGADAVFKELLAEDMESHPVLEYACARSAAYEADKRIELMSYISPKLFYITEWWKQLFGESEGKDQKGLFPAGLAYTTDLHSLGQYAQDGVRNILETFLHFEKESASGDQGGVERFFACTAD
jgi:glucose-6-phosphate isomerase